MNIEQTKTRLDNISKSTATKHPKVLISELCSVVKFLLDEIERIKSPPTTILETTINKLPEDDLGYQPKCPLSPTPEFPWVPPTTTDRFIGDIPTCSDDSSKEKQNGLESS